MTFSILLIFHEFDFFLEFITTYAKMSKIVREILQILLIYMLRKKKNSIACMQFHVCWAKHAI